MKHVQKLIHTFFRHTLEYFTLEYSYKILLHLEGVGKCKKGHKMTSKILYTAGPIILQLLGKISITPGQVSGYMMVKKCSA